MAEPWNQWYPHDIDTWQGSGNIQALSDTGYRAVHNIMQDMWKQEDCSLPCDQKVLRKASRVADRWESCKEEVMDYFDHTESGTITSNVLRRKWLKAKEIYESNSAGWDETKEARSIAGRAGAKARWQKHGKTMAKVCDADGKPIAKDGLTVTVTSTGTKTTTSTLASTALAVPAARGKLVCTLPLNQGDHEVFEADVQGWTALYPAVDVRQELRSIKGWALSNPTRRKTKGGIARFINSWLSRAQNEAKQGASNGNQRTDAASERKRTSDDAIQAAVARRLGIRAGTPDAAGEGLLPKPDAAGGDAGHVPAGVGGDSTGTGDGAFRGRTLEGSA